VSGLKKIEGQGFKKEPAYKGQVTSDADGFNIRIDDTANPDFWMDIRVPAVKLSQCKDFQLKNIQGRGMKNRPAYVGGVTCVNSKDWHIRIDDAKNPLFWLEFDFYLE
jgi:hypothetical protein